MGAVHRAPTSTPSQQLREERSPILWPAGPRVLHLAEPADARDPHTGEPLAERKRPVGREGQAHRLERRGDRGDPLLRNSEIGDGLNEDRPTPGRDREERIGIVDHCPADSL